MKYKVGDEFKVIKDNTCGFQIRDVIRIERIEIGDGEEELPYYVDSWYLGDNTTITNGDNDWSIDEFAELITKTEDNTNYGSGSMVIEGRPYEDIVAILLTNGYNVTVSKDNVNDFDLAKFKISYEKR